MTTPRKNFIGINVSGSKIRAALVDEDGRLVERHEAECFLRKHRAAA